MINQIKKSKIILGSPEKRVAPSEIKQIKLIRKSIVAKRELKNGDIIELSDLAFKRPATGIPPFELEKLIGKTLRVSKTPDDPLLWSDLW